MRVTRKNHRKLVRVPPEMACPKTVRQIPLEARGAQSGATEIGTGMAWALQMGLAGAA